MRQGWPERFVRPTLNVDIRIVQPAFPGVRHVAGNMPDNPRHHQEFRANPARIGFEKKRARGGDVAASQQFLSPGLTFKVVFGEDPPPAGEILTTYSRWPSASVTGASRLSLDNPPDLLATVRSDRVTSPPNSANHRSNCSRVAARSRG